MPPTSGSAQGFTLDWLRLREPFDRAARDAAAQALCLPQWSASRRRGHAALTVIDLGGGTGANLRYLAPMLSGSQRWHIVDHDAALLDALPQAMQAWVRRQDPHGLHCETRGAALYIGGAGLQIEVHRQRLDLAQDLDRLPIDGADLITASALLDLVSEAWLDRLLALGRLHSVAWLFALNVNGRIEWQPTDRDDAQILSLIEAHQRRDKGFGAALGPSAPSLAAQRLKSAGYTVRTAASDWIASGDLLTELARAMAGAAIEQSPASRDTVQAWRGRRLAIAERSTLRVGHTDLIAVPS